MPAAVSETERVGPRPPARPDRRLRRILHVDMDAFFAAVEILDDPTLAGRPLVVGGTGRRGVVASCSYEARVFGVHSAMPTAQARRLCPHAVFVPGRHDRYAELSRSIHAVLQRFTPLVEGISLDEAFLDVTGSERAVGPAEEIAWSIRSAIAQELRLDCSVGVAPAKFLAKLASEAAKPTAGPAGVQPGRGVVVIRPGEELAFLHPLTIETLWGVGPATAARLRRLGVHTVGDLAAVPCDVLEATVGRAHGRHLGQLARGVDDRPVEPERETKSVSQEETYPLDRRDRDGLRDELLRMADAVATRVRRAGRVGRTVTLKVRFGDFTTLTRSRTEPAGVADGQAIASIARALFDAIDVTRGVRLLGVGVSSLAAPGPASAEQMTLDLDRAAPPRPGGVRGDTGAPGGAERPSPAARRAAASGAVDSVRERFGAASLGPAALLGPGGIRVKRTGDAPWGPGAEPPGGAGGPRSGS